MTENIWSILTAAVGGGLITKLLSFFLDKKKQRKDDFESIITVFKEENERLRQSEALLKLRVQELEEKILSLTYRISQLEISRVHENK
jgi:phage shock protein A